MRAVSIIVPTLNEAENIDLLLERIYAVERLREFDLEVVFSDGASTDRTCEHIEKWQSSKNIRLVHNQFNSGLSAAVMAGARVAKGEFVIVMDADLSHPPEVIPDMLESLLSGEFDMVIGSRYVKGGDTPEWPRGRKISSQLATFPARLLTDVKDPLAGFIGVKRDRLASMNRDVCGFKIGLELLATSEDKLRVKEIPIIFRDRCHGASKMGLHVVLDYCRQLLILAGIDFLPCRFQEISIICLVALITDCTLLTVLLESGYAPGRAHCISFLPATMIGGVMVYGIYRKNNPKTPGRRLTEYIFGFFWVFLLTILLRSGLVASLNIGGHGFSTASVFIIGLFGVTASYVGNVCYVFSIGRKRIRGPLVQRFYGLGAAAFLVSLRLAYCGGITLLPEEQYYADILQSNGSLSDFFSAPGPAMIGALGQFIFSDTIFGFRLGGWLLWFVAVTCVFNLARDMYNRSVAFRALLLFSVLPFFVGTGFFISQDMVLTVFWCGAAYLLYRALVGGGHSAWIWSGIILGFGLQADVRLVTLLAGVALYLLLSRDTHLFYTAEPYKALAAMFLTLIPSLLLLGGGGTSKGYEEIPWLSTILGVSLSQSYWLPFLLLSPVGFMAGGYVCVQWCRGAADVQLYSGWENNRTRLFLLTLFFLPLALFMIPVIFAEGVVCASSMVWLVLLPSMALTIGLKPLASNMLAAAITLLWWPTIGTLMVIYGTALHLAAL